MTLAASGLAQQPSASSDDPRMAGFKGKIAKRYEDSKEDWPKRPVAPAGAPTLATDFGAIGEYMLEKVKERRQGIGMSGIAAMRESAHARAEAIAEIRRILLLHLKTVRR